MKNSQLIIIIASYLIFSGCALILPTQSFLKPVGANKYSIKVYEGRGADIYAKWDEEAQKQCGSKKFSTINQQYIKNPDGLNYLTGTFECKPESEQTVTQKNPPPPLIAAPEKLTTEEKPLPPGKKTEPTIEKPLPPEKKTKPVMTSQDPSPTSPSIMIVTQNKTKLRKTPNTKAGVVKNLNKGDEVKVVRQKDDWFLVELSGGEVGWCHKSLLKRRD